ncbi:MAG: hypothetical protein Q7T82_19140 [Armatimonadota bacterium]|nr:hypothetical protein [Armatimonadota bacterium]
MKSISAVAFSALLILTMICAATADPGPPGPAAILERLDLSDSQRAKLRDVLRSSGQVSDRTRQALVDERQRLRRLYDDYDLNMSRARDSIARVNKLQRDLLDNSLERQIRLRDVLAPRQFVQLNRVIGPESPVIERMDAERGGPSPDRLPQLSLDPDQQSAIEKMWQSRKNQSGDVYRDMRRDLQAIGRLYDNHRLDEGKARRLIGGVNKLQLQILQARLERQLKLRKILNEQQFRILTEHVRRSSIPPFARGPRRR